jgi:hypothetical protein
MTNDQREIQRKLRVLRHAEAIGAVANALGAELQPCRFRRMRFGLSSKFPHSASPATPMRQSNFVLDKRYCSIASLIWIKGHCVISC